jgi:hypothetical protein
MSALELPEGTVRFGYRSYEMRAFREAEAFGELVWAGEQPVAVMVQPDNPRRQPFYVPWHNVTWLVAEG